MKRFLSLFSVFIATLILAGCATSHVSYPNNKLINETWAGSVQRAPNHWLHGADRWFVTGDPSMTEQAVRNAPIAAMVSTMKVRTGNFNNIRVNGDFQVQIFGTYDKNSVYVYGPNVGVNAVAVEVHGNTLCVTQRKNASRKMVKAVIVRIGINQLRHIAHYGCGTVEGIQLHSNALSVYSSGLGNMYLAGNLGLREVTSAGPGGITMFGVRSYAARIISKASGKINLSGQVGIKSIYHCGSGDINVIGANSDSNCAMTIDTTGSGKIGLSGQANIKQITARGNTCVYACPVQSACTYVYAYDNAQVGLMGVANKLVVNTQQHAKFYGRSLCVADAFVRAKDGSHINVSATSKIFAAATQGASVYFFGEPKLMSQFVSGNGVVIPIWYAQYRQCPVMNVNSMAGAG